MRQPPIKFAETFFALAREREQIRRQRLTGAPAPWTEDPIFQQWRFTNVHRENDKTTAWFREHVRTAINLRGIHSHERNIKHVEAAIIFRWFNWIETAERILPMLTIRAWDSEEAKRLLTGVKPLVTGAYMVHSPYGMNKLDGLISVIDEARRRVPSIVAAWQFMKRPLTLQEAHRDITRLPNMGEFTAGEVICDLRWTPVLENAPDINSWVIAGPGCARGLGYAVDGKPFRYKYGSAPDQIEMLAVMSYLLSLSRCEDYWPKEWQPWELHEVEMWACEYAKYQNAARGARLKRRYP